MARDADDLMLDRLPESADGVQVEQVDGMRVAAGEARAPHRHDYHELVWVRSGRGRHMLDGQPLPVVASAVTIIGRGQVHVFECAEEVSGAIVRFGDDVVFGDDAQRATPGWMLAGRGGRVVPVPAGDVDHLEAAIAALQAETTRSPDACTSDLERHLVSTLLLWLERWYDASRTERRDPDDADVELLRRFTRLLEDDFARHHEAAHYADALAVTHDALSRALAAVTGQPTKELVTDRVMLEARRLLRFTDLSVQEIAARVGFNDPLYFSRAFKRRHGESPSDRRARWRASRASS